MSLGDAFIFAEDVPSAVTRGECERLFELAADQRVLELGSHLGRSTIALAGAAREVHAVDWHHGDEHAGEADSLEPFLANLERFGVRAQVVVHVGRFADVLSVLRPQAFGLVFVDGRHAGEAVIADIQASLPLLAPGGTLAVHDHGRFDVAGACAMALGREPDELAETLAVYRR